MLTYQHKRKRGNSTVKKTEGKKHITAFGPDLVLTSYHRILTNFMSY
jgi:hypothetical protein